MRLAIHTVILGLVAALFAGTVQAYEVKAYAKKTRKAKLADFVPKADRAENKKNKFYIEQYFYTFKPADGSKFWFQIAITNMGLANGRAALVIDFKPKGGKKTHIKVPFKKRSDWSYSKDGGKLTIKLSDKNTFSGDGDSWTAHFDTDKLTVDCTITNGMRAIRPGGGNVFYGKGGKQYYDVTLLTPRGTFEADITVKATGEKHHLTGVAFGDNSTTNVSPNLQASHRIKLRKISKKLTILVNLVRTSEQFESKWVGFFFIASGKRMLGVGLNPTVDTADMEKDPKTGYQIPRIVLLSGGQGVEGLKVAIKGLKQTGRHDRLADLTAVERAVVSKLVQPVVFRYRAAFEFQFMRKGKPKTFKGKGRYSFEQTSE